MSIWIIPVLIAFILLYGTWKKVPTYEAFVEGGKEGIQISVQLIPFLLGMLVAISVFRASGALDFFIDLLQPILHWIGVPTEIVPLALIRPISGAAGLAITTDLMTTFGADSYVGRLASVIQGSTDTTLYILTVYFGAVGVKKMKYALKVGLWADFIGIVSAIVFVTLMFGKG